MPVVYNYRKSGMCSLSEESAIEKINHTNSSHLHEAVNLTHQFFESFHPISLLLVYNITFNLS